MFLASNARHRVINSLWNVLRYRDCVRNGGNRALDIGLRCAKRGAQSQGQAKYRQPTLQQQSYNTVLLSRTSATGLGMLCTLRLLWTSPVFSESWGCRTIACEVPCQYKCCGVAVWRSVRCGP